MTQPNDDGYNLVKLVSTDLTPENPTHHVRSHEVRGSSGEETATVEDLYVNDDEHKVRFLNVGAGGLLGLGKKHFLAPVGVISEVTEDRVVY